MLRRILCPSALIAAVALGPTAGVARAQTVLDPVGIPVCLATGVQSDPTVVATPDGGVITTWLDRRRGSSLADVYATHVLPDGSLDPAWPADGLALCTSGTASRPFIVPDGGSGAIVFWHDSRVGHGEIYAQRISQSGQLADGWPANGKQITAVRYDPWGGWEDDQSLLDVIADGHGGAYLARRRRAPFSGCTWATAIRVTRYGTLAPGWTADGVGVSGGCLFNVAEFGGDVGNLARDPGGGVFAAISWLGHVPPEIDYRATVTKISPEGVVAWSRTPLTHFEFGYGHGIWYIAVTADGRGGCIAAWMNYYEPSFPAYYLEATQHYSESGTLLWPDDTPAAAYQIVESDGAGGAYFIGGEYGVPVLEVHRRRSDFVAPPGWWSGVRVSEPAAMGKVARAVFDGTLYLCWSAQESGGSHDVHAIAIDSSGTVLPGWTSDGVVVSAAAGDETLPAMALLPSGQLFAVWEDRRNIQPDIRAARIGAPTTAVDPTRVSAPLTLAPARPNPARERAQFEIVSGDVSAFALDVVDVRGRVVSVPLRRHASRIELDTSHLENGVYWLRVSTPEHAITRRFAVLH